MTTPASDTAQPLAELVTYLFTRREAILNQWRGICEQDPTLGKVSTLSREEFNNLLPIILDILKQRLLNNPLEVDPALTAQTHGWHRWHKANGLINTLQEMNYLAQILYDELKLFQQLFPHFELTLIIVAQPQIAQLMQETVDDSVQKYDELQCLQATNRVNSLQQAVDQMTELFQQWGDLLRESSHNLRGSFGLINSAAYLLSTDGLSEADRKEFMDMLNHNLGNVQGMLTSLMDLSRLEAGQDPLHVESIDAAQLLRELVVSTQPMATERGVMLWADGPQTLPIETDRVKLQRIVQNLLVNAIKYTTSAPEHPAIVSISWAVEGEYRWAFSVQDSGPGLADDTLTGILGQQLRPTVEPTSMLGTDQSEPVAVLPDGIPPVPTPAQLDALPAPLPKSKGVGLQIVKRLCELLDANLDVESKPNRGTLFRVRLPVHHTA